MPETQKHQLHVQAGAITFRANVILNFADDETESNGKLDEFDDVETRSNHCYSSKLR